MIKILMAVYNGEKYLSAQIESILSQTVKDWKLIIQDDCSTDETFNIAKEFANKHPDRISAIQRKTQSGSAKDNFFSMVKYADTEYTMLCDQDDIWLPDKIEITLRKMQELEEKTGFSEPILVHTDLKVVDSQMNVIDKSLFEYQKLDKCKDKLNNLLIQNIVTGCTVMVNHILITKANKVPVKAIMHDWWLALIAVAFGHLGFVDKPTVLYRQHRSNEVGAKDVASLSYIVKKTMSVVYSPKNARSLLSSTYAQAECFISTFREDLSEVNLQILSAYISIPHNSKIRRLKIVSKYDFWKTGIARRVGQVMLT
jgi:glycosyltransferase involved in cell wall biosynthesis